MVWVLIGVAITLYGTHDIIKKSSNKENSGFTLILCVLLIVSFFGCHENQEERIKLNDRIMQLEDENMQLEDELEKLKNPEGKKYFQTYDSGVIHNSDCFWFGKSDGRYIDDPSHGRDCLECGGRKSK